MLIDGIKWFVNFYLNILLVYFCLFFFEIFLLIEDDCLFILILWSCEYGFYLKYFFMSVKRIR